MPSTRNHLLRAIRICFDLLVSSKVSYMLCVLYDTISCKYASTRTKKVQVGNEKKAQSEIPTPKTEVEKN